MASLDILEASIWQEHVYLLHGCKQNSRLPKKDRRLRLVVHISRLVLYLPKRNYLKVAQADLGKQPSPSKYAPSDPQREHR
jgi:hypothetical protein